MKLAPGVHIIETSFWGRPLNLVLFRGHEVVLIDTGLVGIPQDAVCPALSSLDLTPKNLFLIVITHGHADHFGGNEELWLASERKIHFAAHRFDKDWIEDPASQSQRRYRHYVDLGLWTADGLAESIQASGNGVTLDSVLEGGEVFDIGEGLELHIIFAPGHTFGNICVMEKQNKILVQGETITGTAQYDVEGQLLTVPFYEDPEVYLKTIALVASLDFETLLSSHLPIMGRQAAARLLEESLDFTLRFDAEIKNRIKNATQPLTSLSLLESLDQLWGAYPADVGMYMLLETEIKSLLKRGLVNCSQRSDTSLIENLIWTGPEKDDLEPLAHTARAAIQTM